MRSRIDAMITSKSPSSSSVEAAAREQRVAVEQIMARGVMEAHAPRCVSRGVEYAELDAVGDEQVALGQRSVGITTG